MATQKGRGVSGSKAVGSEVSINLDRLSAALQAAIANSLQRLAEETQQGLAPETRGVGKTVPVAGEIEIYEDDPFLEAAAGSSPVPADPISIDVPNQHAVIAPNANRRSATGTWKSTIPPPRNSATGTRTPPWPAASTSGARCSPAAHSGRQISSQCRSIWTRVSTSTPFTPGIVGSTSFTDWSTRSLRP